MPNRLVMQPSAASFTTSLYSLFKALPASIRFFFDTRIEYLTRRVCHLLQLSVRVQIRSYP